MITGCSRADQLMVQCDQCDTWFHDGAILLSLCIGFLQHVRRIMCNIAVLR